MISVPSHRLRLNGSRILMACLVILGSLSCTSSRKAVKKPPVSTPPVEKTDKIRVYDPKTDSYILVPRDGVKVDTVNWIEDKTPPLLTDDTPQKDKPVEKSRYEIALLLPFNAAGATFYSEIPDHKLSRFLQYYAGMKLAIDDIYLKGWPLTFRSYDAESSSPFLNVLKKPGLSKADVIIGPYEKEDIELTAAFGMDHEIMVVSPWLPAFPQDEVNPFLVQLYPGLSAHAQATMDYIQTAMPEKKIYIVARNISGDLNRISLFSKNTNLITHELIIDDASPDLIKTDLNTLLSEDRGSIFILPFYTKADEAFVNSFMRKLHADKGTREAIVFGLPQWLGFMNLNANYMESLSVHLSTSSFVDTESPLYASFRTRFFNTYATVPDLQAYQGYDLITWLAQVIVHNGQTGLISEMDPFQYGLSSGFYIRPVYKNEIAPSKGEMNVPMHYENKRIRIIRFVDQDFVLVR